MRPKKYFDNRTKKINKVSCFLIMSFAEKFDNVYEMYRSTLQSEKINLICRRGDGIHRPHIIQTIKLFCHYNEFRIDKQAEKISPQYLFVSEDSPTQELSIIPWTRSNVEAHGNTGRISIDKI